MLAVGQTLDPESVVKWREQGNQEKCWLTTEFLKEHKNVKVKMRPSHPRRESRGIKTDNWGILRQSIYQ